MADPARNLYDDELPEDTFAPRPKLGVVEGGGETTDRKKGHLRSVGGEDLAGQEEAATNKKPGTDKTEGELSALRDAVDDDDSLFSEDEPTSGRFRGWSTRKKATAGALGVGGFTAFFFTFFLGSVPLQIIQMAQLLQSNNINNEETADYRIAQLYRFARSGGDVGETRLSQRGSRSVARTREALAEIGIQINSGSRFIGEFGDVTIDPSKFPDTKGIVDEDAIISRLRDAYPDADLNIERIVDADGNPAFRLTGAANDRFATYMVDTSVGHLGGGRISTGMKARPFKNYFNNPSLLHPLKRVASNAENRLGRRLASRAALRERARELQAERAPPETPETRQAKANIESRTSGIRSAIVGALTYTGAACIIYDSSGDIIELNRARIVLPAVIEAVHIISMASQIYMGEDINWEDMNATVENWTNDDGESVWDAKALNATKGERDPGGPDITNENKQAFAGESTEAGIRGFVEDLPLIPEACSTPGQIIQGIVSIATLIGTGGAGATGSTFSKVVLTRAVGVAIKEAIKGAIFGTLSDMAINRIEVWISDDPFFEQPVSGPLGGNMLAYGAREMANMTARGSGGVALSAAETLAIDQRQIEKQREDFQKESFATRMFDLKDYRSFAAVTMQKVGGNPIAKSTNAVASLGGARSLFANLSTIFIPGASAINDSNYEWFSPRYGIPKEVLENPDYADPYAVADAAAALLEDDTRKERAEKCFGVNFVDSSEGLDVVPEKDVNPGEIEYTDADCTENSGDWHKIMLFVNDSMDMTTVACYDGTDESACDALGFDSATDASSTVAGEGIVGDPFETSVNVDCAPGTNDLGVHTGYYQGNPIEHRMCAIPGFPSTSSESSPGSSYYLEGADGNVIVNSRVSGAVLALKDAANAELGGTIGATSSFRTMAHQQALWDEDVAAGSCPGTSCGTAEPGTSNHQSGVAIDFAEPPGNSSLLGGVQGPSNSGCGNRATAFGIPLYDWLFDNAERFGYKQLAFESWHWDPDPDSCDSSSGRQDE